MELKLHEEALAGCRFCPMCKPASEVGRLRKVESYSTRSRAMMMWRIANGHDRWTPRSTELLYQSTLDGIAESWCVSHRPVTAYQLAARQDVWTAGIAPDPVQRAVDRSLDQRILGDGGVVLLAGEFADAGDMSGAKAAGALLSTGVAWVLTGATAYCLGAWEVAKLQAQEAASLLDSAKVVIGDGPQTDWMINEVWADLGVKVDCEVVSLSARVIAGLDAGELEPAIDKDLNHYFLDARAASYQASELAVSRTIQPGFQGPEEDLGKGVAYDSPRSLLDRLGVSRVSDRWSRSLAWSCGSDDGLWATYPDLAKDLAYQSVSRVRDLGAEMLVVDSPLASRHLSLVADDSVAVSWIGDMVRRISE